MLGAVGFELLLSDVTNEAESSQTPGDTWHRGSERAHHHTGMRTATRTLLIQLLAQLKHRTDGA